MYTTTVTYEDFDGNKRTEEFSFHLNRSELMDWLMVENGVTLDKVLETMAKKEDIKSMAAQMKELLYRSYGEKSADGRRFDKSEETKRNFMDTEAFSVLHMKLITDANFAVEFITKVIPSDLGKEMEKYMKEHGNEIPEQLKPYVS